MNLKTLNINKNSTKVSKVYLNVYDLHSVNKLGHCLGFGIYHSAVEVNGVEYCFSGHEFTFSGLFEIKPKTATGVIFRESIYMGDINLSNRQFQSIIDSIAEDFPGLSYHPLKKNCNTFSNELIKRLLNKEIPNYVNRAAFFGTFFSCFLPRSFGFIPQESESSPAANRNYNSNNNNNSNTTIPFSGKGHSLYNGDNGGPKPMVIPDVNYNKDGSSRLIFYGSDNDDSSASGSNNNSPTVSKKGNNSEDNEEIEKRKRLLIAANKRLSSSSSTNHQIINTTDSTTTTTTTNNNNDNTNTEFISTSDFSSTSSTPTTSDSLSPTISSPLINNNN